nr:YeeE/YedE family protein [uncultured Tolumonas sp.]
MITLLAGVLFGFGLALSGMMQPDKVVGFLNITGEWDASLMLVMGGALAVFTPGYHFLIKKRQQTWNGAALHLPTKKALDRQLVFGALIFGAGWGLAGICPGPAIAMVALIGWPAIVFILAMVVGMLIAGFWQQKKNLLAEQITQLAASE